MSTEGHASKSGLDAALQEQLSELETLYRDAPIGLCLLDRNLRYVRINSWLAKYNRRPPADHIGRSILETIPAIAPLVESHIRRVLDTGQPVLNIEVEGRRPADPGATPVCLLAAFYPLLAADRVVVGVSIIVQDITSIKVAEQRLRDEKYLSECVTESIPGLFFMVDDEGRLVRWNKYAEKVLGHAADDLRSMRAVDLIEPDDRPRLETALTRARREGSATTECAVLTREGRLIPHFGYCMHVEIGGRDYLCALVIDISAHKRAEEELGERYRFETLVAGLSARFVNLALEDVGQAIEDGLRRIVEFLDIDRSTLAQFTDDGAAAFATHSYTVSEVPRIGADVNMFDILPETSKILLRGDIVRVPKIAAVGEGHLEEIKIFEQMGLQSLLAIPLRVGETTLGALGFGAIRKEQAWPEATVKRLQLIAGIFANALARQDSDRQLKERYHFEQLIANLSARFVDHTAGDVDAGIQHGLKRIMEFMNVELGVLLQFSADKGQLTFTHSCSQPGFPQFSLNVDVYARYATHAEKLLRGETWNVSRLDDLSGPARAEVDFLAQKGLKSYSVFPLPIGGEIVGAMGFAAFVAEKTWAPQTIQRLKVVGEIFGNALARKRADAALRGALVQVKKLQMQLETECYFLRQEIDLAHDFGAIVGESRELKEVMQKIQQVAPTDTTVLVLGETGTGKELVARAIHNASPRSKRPLVKVDCTVLPPDLMESELFGHEKGAFTSAHTRQIGRFEVAHEATVFLDEIGELPPALQVKLLRVLQDGEFERLGSAETIKVDVRIIAATNRDLAREVRAGRFREDLWYRLNVYPITVPPLRRRREDIPLLVAHMIAKLDKRLGKTVATIPQGVLDALQAYDWPGNVRELENVIERAVINTPDSQLRLVDHLVAREDRASEFEVMWTLAEVERSHIAAVLAKTGWKIEGKGGAAEILGLRPSTLRGRMQKLRLRRP
jgi:formate hydrogenlyase transcriptional activator